jgi:hypothetical protein
MFENIFDKMYKTSEGTLVRQQFPPRILKNKVSSNLFGANKYNLL